jgi:hypothetical protein
MKPFDPARALKALAGFAGFGIAVSGLYAATGFGFPCPLRLLTGWECPLCGGTRLGSALLHGHIGQAFLYNPIVFIGLVVASVLGLLWVIEVAGGPKLRPPRSIAERLTRVHPTRWAVGALVAAIAYTLGRNLF